ncbi:MAG: N-acetylglutaminylglutamine synthetase [Kiloniellales bacterium]
MAAQQRRMSDRLARRHAPSLNRQHGSKTSSGEEPRADAVVDCGWGRLIFGHTFGGAQAISEALLEEESGRRDIAFYLHDPHVVLSIAPQNLFLDPSHSYRLWLDRYRPGRGQRHGFIVRRIRDEADAGAIRRIYDKAGMVAPEADFIWERRADRAVTYLVAEDPRRGEVIGTVTGIDHKAAFDDPEKGASLWCLAVDPQAPYPGVGELLVRHLAELMQTRGRAFLDLSVMHDNEGAIKLYEKLGFERIPVFAVKTKNSINETLYSTPAPDASLNPYAGIIVDEARRRGIVVEVLDAPRGYFRLINGARSIVCRESLSELTTAIAMSRCDDKTLTLDILRNTGLKVPEQRLAGSARDNAAFLKRHGALVAKPQRGEQGQGVSVNLTDARALETAVKRAGKGGIPVILEQFVSGQDLRIIVIDFEVAAAAVRRPACVVGNGRSTVKELIEAQSRRRAAATGGESRIPLDAETARCLASARCGYDTLLEKGKELQVRQTANLHTGGTIHDVTDKLHPALADAAVKAAQALDIPVVGFDFLVPAVEDSAYVIIEANERPGLANHEPAPTAQRFVDLLFPATVSQARRRKGAA